MLSKSQIKYIQSLGQKKFRDEAGVYIAEGPKIIKELLEENNVEVYELFAVKDWLVKNTQQLSGFPVQEITSEELHKISQMRTPNNVLAIIKKNLADENIDAKIKIALALDMIQDPGNFGAIIRIADWFGVDHVICSNDCADIYNPKVVQATMGSIIRVKVIYVDLGTWLKDQKEKAIYATALEGQNITNMNPISDGIIIIGNESKGIRSEIMELTNIKITIPKTGKAESLNAAVATGIILSHLVV